MSQVGFTPISIYYSSTATNTPTAGNLVAGELAINTADGKLFYKDSAGVVQVIGTKGGVGSSTTTQVLYNSSGLVVGSANMTFNGTTLTLANDASISGLTVGKGGGAVGTNTVAGYNAGSGNTTGAYNTALGYLASVSNSTSNFNTSIGFYALNATTGAENTAVGAGAGQLNTTGADNSILGNYALYTNTTGSNNTAIGQRALQANTTASNNTAVGYQAGYSNTTGSPFTAIGMYALKANTTGTNNTATGYASSFLNTTGTANSSYGDSALYSNTTGGNNTAIGYYALVSNTTASNNTAVGFQAGYADTTGTNNVFVGTSAGSNLTTGSGCVFVGNGIQASAVGNNYEMVISGNAVAGKGGSTGFINPNSGGVYQGNNSATWSITSDARLKKNIVDNTTGLSAISQIQVRNFEYRIADEITDLPKEQAIAINGIQLGAIAQELKEILPDCVKTESTGVMSVDTTNLTWYLINAVKELNAKIIALENK